MSCYRPGTIERLMKALADDCERRGLTRDEARAEIEEVLTRAMERAERAYRASPITKHAREIAIAAAASRVRLVEEVLGLEPSP